MPHVDGLMTFAQAAELCACSVRTLRRAANAGALRVTRLGQSPRSDRIAPTDLQAFIDARKVEVVPLPSFRVALEPRLPHDPAHDRLMERIDNLLGSRSRKRRR